MSVTNRERASVLFIADAGLIQIVCNASGWKEMSKWCLEMAEKEDMTPPEDSWKALHLRGDMIDEKDQERVCAAFIDGAGSVDAANWVLFLKSDLLATEYLTLRDTLFRQE